MGSSTEADTFLRETIIELHFRDQHDQNVHNQKLQKGEAPRKVSLAVLMQEIIQAHATGIKFREWNAG
jgi:hypothetical protein